MASTGNTKKSEIEALFYHFFRILTEIEALKDPFNIPAYLTKHRSSAIIRNKQRDILKYFVKYPIDCVQKCLKASISPIKSFIVVLYAECIRS